MGQQKNEEVLVDKALFDSFYRRKLSIKSFLFTKKGLYFMLAIFLLYCFNVVAKQYIVIFGFIIFMWLFLRDSMLEYNMELHSSGYIFFNNFMKDCRLEREKRNNKLANTQVAKEILKNGFKYNG